MLSVAACGSSNTASPTSSPSTSASPNAAAPSTTTPPPGKPEAHVSGLIASVSGNAAQVTLQERGENGNATVDFTDSTKVTEVTPAALTDVTTGNCVAVRPTHGESQGGQSVTAALVRVSPAVNGKCPQAAKSGQGPSSTPPSGAPTPPHGGPGIQGTVASVAGNTINITSSDSGGSTAQTAVTVTDKTRYTKQAGSSTQAIAQGKCMTAIGNQDGNGTLQATAINLRPANEGKCPGDAKPHGHGG